MAASPTGKEPGIAMTIHVYHLEDFLDYILVTGRGFMSDWAISMDEDEVRVFHDSVARAQANGVFFDAFYDALMENMEESSQYCSNEDMQRVKSKLAGSLKMIAQMKDDGTDGVVEFSDLSRGHTRFHVTEGMYQLWLESVLKAVSLCDPHFNNHLEGVWRKIVGDGISHMIERTGPVGMAVQ